MTRPSFSRRAQVAQLARRLLADPGFAPAFEAALHPDDDADPLLDELVDLVRHLPPRASIVGPGWSDATQRARIAALLAEAEGKPPPRVT